jgi:hypothetical protein
MFVAKTLIPDTVTLEFPLFFRLTVRVCVLPTDSFPKFRLVGVAVKSRVASTPVPVSVSVLFAAVLMTEALAVTEPVAVGAKTRVQLTVWPGANTDGVVRPLSWNSGLLTAHEEIVNRAVPVFFSWIVCEWVDPKGTLPKLALLGVAVSVATATPVPVIW